MKSALFKRLLSAALACAMLAGNLPAISRAEATTQINVMETETFVGDAPATLAASSGTCGTNLTYTFANGTLTISGNGAMTNYSWDDTPWYSIRESITDVVIESGVTSIGSHAFYECSSLTSVTIPEGVTSIGSHAFSECSRLASVTIPESVTTIGSYAFAWCSSLTSVTIHEGVTSIGNNAFYYCSNLTSVTIPGGVTSIGSSAFSDCRSLTSVTIPSSVTSIGSDAFQNCRSLTTVNYGGTQEQWDVIEIGDGNEWMVYIKNGIGTCGENVTWTLDDNGTLLISGNGAMTDYTGSGDVPWYSIRDSITNVVIESGVTSIGSHAFYSCSKLTSVTIPCSVSTI